MPFFTSGRYPRRLAPTASDDEPVDHQLWIDGWPLESPVVVGTMLAKVTLAEKTINSPQKPIS